ncbi:MAG: chloride channel protein [Atopobiaceae bacterium]|jgi:H+/Cl- antiporter ClcA|nr:chloride channel protein [Atopobiaceae bacterium]
MESGRRIRDASDEPLGTGSLPRLTVGLVALSLALGAVVAIAVRGMLWAYKALTGLVWVRLAETVRLPAFPLLACALGGLLVGLWARHRGRDLDSLETVMAQVRSTGGYHLADPAGAVVSFLLPLVFGGAVGPEAGASGIIAAAVTWIGEQLRHAGVAAVRITDATLAAVLATVFGAPLMGVVGAAEDNAADYERFTFSRWPKFVLYASACLGAVLGALGFSAVFGGAAGLPRFDSPLSLDAGTLPWGILFAAVGYLLAQLSRLMGGLFAGVARSMGDDPLGKALACGVALGVAGLLLPDVLFSGEDAMRETMESWQQTGAVVLLATGLAKLCATQACVSMEWMGGLFFPMIFSGVTVGYGLAALTGADPMLAVVVVTASLVAGVTRKPLLSLSVLALCFPLVDLPVMALAAFASGKVPALVRGEEGDRR